ncbi:choline BCCT transporter BetT [Escherichia coli]|nr:choline BCCT transporter BetT [Escherichia coli]EFQ9902800.1 choline BCCT transporter BetT [Escherichia coli]EFR1908279.1 choline BCCT transporter BetT [Escherichia coli]EFR2168909.1 choline BCCT transporter BetT [Escherichia coli]EGX9892381.1 choline BCCT transporter BetT [Escherichia coli]
MTDLSHSREKDKINPVVFYTSAGLILLFSLTTILFRDFSALWIGRTLDWVSKTFGWYYLLAATLYIVFVVCIACSRFGSVKLGPEQSKPEFSLLSWAAMLFAAGIGIDLMFFSVAEPVTQYMQPPEGAGQTIEAARQAMVWTLFHYGLTGWSMYALMGMTLNSFAFDRPVEWMNNWTLFFWAWWVAWSPFVGLFLARISRGRTIRQFVLGTLIIPFTFTLLWLSVFGNSALYEIIHGGAAFAEEAMVHPERGFYSLLAQYPAFTFSASVATITGLLFYVTSADSGALVLGNFTSQLKDINSDAPGWLRVFWSVAIGLLTLGMLMTNGISALQNTTVIMGLPFSFVIFFVMAGLYKSLKVEDYRRESANRDTAPRPLGLQDRLSWKKRLSRLMNYPGTRYTKQMMETVCYPAMEEVAQELRLRGAYVELKSLPPEEGQQLGHLDLLVHMGEEQNFVYQIWPQQYSVPGFTYRARSGKSTYYRLETFLLEGSQGNDLMDYSKEQVITDILDQYERHLNFIHLHREAPGHSVMFPDA